MEFELKKTDKFLIVKPLDNQLGYSQCTEFKSKFMDILSEGHRHILLDLSKITSLDSSGVGTLVNVGLKTLSYTEGKFALCCPQSKIEEILLLTHVNLLFPLFATEKKAIESLSPETVERKAIMYLGNNAQTYELLRKHGFGIVNFVFANSLAYLEEIFTHQEGTALIIEEVFITPELTKTLEKLFKGKNIPLIALMSSTQKIAEAAQLKTKYGISHILELPLQNDEAETLIHEIVGIKTKSDTPTLPLPEKLFNEYKASLPEKLQNIETLIEALLNSPSKETVQNLRQAVHKIAGSAGSYGYVKAGEGCKKMEGQLDEALEKNSYGPELFSEIQQFFKTLKFYFSVPLHRDLSQKNVAIQPISTGRIFLITQDLNLINTFQHAIEETQISLEFESNPETALDHLKSLSYRPESLIVEKSFPGSLVKGFDIVHAFKNIMSSTNVKFGLIVEEESLEDNLKASKEGIDFILKKPVSLKNIEQLLEKFTIHKTKSSYKVLIVDDDIDVCQAIASALEEVNITVMIQSDETKILDTLYQFQPNLLLLDIQMPNYDGWSLLKTLRTDIRYEKLKVIIITGTYKDVSELRRNHQEDYDDIWSKPLEKTLLQQKIAKLAQYSAIPAESMEKIFSSLLPQHKFQTTLQNLLNSSSDQSKNHFLVIFGSVDYKNIKMAGRHIIEEYLISCENLLNQYITHDTLRGYLGEGRFAFYFSGISLQKLEPLLDKFIEETEYKISYKAEEVVFTTFSALALAFSPTETTAEKLIPQALTAFEKNILLPSQKIIV